MTWLLVAVGGMVGAPLRYLVDRAVSAGHDSPFPWGTLAVNVTGCFALGVLVVGVPDDDLQLLLGTGLCGALTTYSTFSYETLRLVKGRAGVLALANVVANLALGLTGLWAGFALGGLV